jgi:hypothetical protein
MSNIAVSLAARRANVNDLQTDPVLARYSTSLEEAGLELLTFYDFPKATWKSIRTTNTLENLNREFRRRTKTQASFGTEDAALTVLYGLVAFGQIELRRIDGYEQLPSFLHAARPPKQGEWAVQTVLEVLERRLGVYQGC